LLHDSQTSLAELIRKGERMTVTLKKHKKAWRRDVDATDAMLSEAARFVRKHTHVDEEVKMLKGISFGDGSEPAPPGQF
jgi:hypothetical protein